MSTSDKVADLLLDNFGQIAAILFGGFFLLAAGHEWLATWLDRSNTGLVALLVLGLGLTGSRLRWPSESYDMDKLIGRIEAGAAAAALTKLDEQVYGLGIDPALDAVHDLIEALRLESSDVARQGKDHG